jgi:glutathione S-transferase
VVYGAQGTGSVPVEATLTLLGLPYRVVEAYGDDPALYAANPMRQVPALILPGGELMTESAAILIWLADSHPEARLAPTMAAHARPAFLRWMAFVSAAIYASTGSATTRPGSSTIPSSARSPRRASPIASSTAGGSWRARSTLAATSSATR